MTEHSKDEHKEITPDYRIGCRVWKYPKLKGYFSLEDNLSNASIKEGKVSITIHTHGIRISSGFCKTLNLHYSLINSIEYVSPGKLLEMLGVAAKAAVMGTIGYLTGDVSGALQGAFGEVVSAEFQSAIRICYRDPHTNDKNTIDILTKTKEITEAFIEVYNKEIDITKRTGRSPNLVIGTLKTLGKGLLTLGKGLLIFAGIIVAIIIILITWLIIESPSSSKTIDEKNENEVTAPPTTDASTEPQQNEKGWNTIGDTKCKLSASSGTLTLIKDKNILEIQSPSIYDGLNEISIIFDHNEPIQAKCTSVDSSKIRIAADRSLIKKMRNGTNMKIIVPGNDSAENKTLKFSLMGFSKACEWAK